MYDHGMEAHGLNSDPTKRIERRLAEVSGHLNVLHAELVSLMAEVLEGGLWQGWGINTPAWWLAWHTGLSPHRARAVVAAAERFAELPVTMAAFAAGELAVDQVAPIVAYVPSRLDGEVCELAKSASVHQLRQVVRAYPFGEPVRASEANGDDATCAVSVADESVSDESAADESVAPGGDADSSAAAPGGDAASAAAVPGDDASSGDAPSCDASSGGAPSSVEARDRVMLAEGSLSMYYDDDGRFRMMVDAPLDAGLVIEAALSEARDALFRAGVRGAGPLDALLECSNRSLDAASKGLSSRADRFRIYVHLDTEGAWVNNGPRVPAALLDRLISDGVVQPLWLTEGRPVSVGRATRVIAPHLRRLVLDRDKGCRTPGCTNTVGVECHHVQWWQRDGGPTDTSNIAGACSTCHDTIHRGDMVVTGNADLPDGLVYTRRDGTVIRGAAPPIPPTGPPPQPDRPYRHPTGERLDRRWLWFSEPPRSKAS